MLDPPAALSTKLKADTGAVATTNAYAEEGLWYDALETISKGIAAAPDNIELRRQRAALLEQVGLAETTKLEKLQ
jgi:hypothetical protein